MVKGYINKPDSECCACEYKVTIEYSNGQVVQEKNIQYSYSDMFEVIKEKHEGDNDRAVKSIKIELIK